MTEIELIELLARAWRGDQGAWSALVRGLSVVVLRVARAHRLGDADAFDVCQNTWVSLAQLRELREPARLPAWLATTARRQALRVLESRRREIPAECDRPDELTPERQVLASERDALLHRAVAQLPAAQRRLVELLMQDPPATHAEIAAELGIAIGSVGPTRRRALDRLRRYLEAHGYDHA
ncbi:RNA polymerase sigma factor [Amycolatopsis tucumanensis]|uniref:Sigma-70 family RNA polymerase sigma factor n=1 Tax=Amycolatopsis tucumanensis TaxID=401106 RepID=A0ABP7I5E9_9PSEU|nr:sigma-70 family RNA polymerase sigma factor [Amycolatopsis tucumanensis]MCF6423109.1 sigma-70 family RNA polymerase sigma factor [Amycolatopsis tucumanensis]